MTTNDTELLRRSRTGDRQAFDGIVERYQERICRYLDAMLGDADVAEDLCQETFRRAWQGLAGFEARSRLSTWLFQIAVNLARNCVRDARSRPRPQDPARLDARLAAQAAAAGTGGAGRGRHGPLTSAIRHESAERIALAIDALPATLREAFVLRFIEGLGYAESARITGVAEATLQVRAHRAKGLLRQRLGTVVDTVWGQAGR